MMDGLKRSEFHLYWMKIMIGTVLIINLLVPAARPVYAQDIPAGFRLIAQQQGVSLYRKDYPNGTPDYVQIIDLTLGASVDLLYGAPVGLNNQHNQGMFGGPNPSFRQKRINTYWDEYSSSQPGAFCVTNGQFFYMPESPTPLGLPLLVDHQLLAEGFGYPQYPEKQLMLALWPDHADILPLTAENLSGTTAESVIGGLTEEANKKPKNSVGRTFIGIWDKNGDLLNETVAIYATQTATQPEAASTVRSFGASKVMMLDGGGSTQLICQGQTYIDTTRAIPQAIGVTAGSQAMPESESPAPEARLPAPFEIAASPERTGSAAALNQDSAAAPPEASATQPEPAAVQEQPATAIVVDPQVEAPDLGFAQPTVQASNLVTASLALPSPGFGQSAQLPDGSVEEAQLDPNISAGSLSAIAGQSGSRDQSNGLDVLWLPAIISPLSVILILVARRQIFMLYRE
jgi:hypothetical protein